MKIFFVGLILMILLVGCSKVGVQPFQGSIYNFGKVDEFVYRGTQPYGDDYKHLKELGVKSVLNLRDDYLGAEVLDVENAGMKYFHLFMSSSHTPRDADIRQAMQILSNPDNLPIYVHCEGGRHRTGVVIAVYRVLHGWDKKKAWDEAYKYDYYRGINHGSIEDWFLNTFNPKDFN